MPIPMPTLTEVDEWLTLPYSADDDDSGSLCDDGGWTGEETWCDVFHNQQLQHVRVAPHWRPGSRELKHSLFFFATATRSSTL